jgi:hypothetical protein
VSIPRLAGRTYDLPPFGRFEGVRWLPTPSVGHARWLTVFLSEPLSSEFRVADGTTVVGVLPMRNGWHMAIVSAERALSEDEVSGLENVYREFKIETARPVRADSEYGAGLWITTSPDGPPLFVTCVLGSENFYEPATSGG